MFLENSNKKVPNFFTLLKKIEITFTVSLINLMKSVVMPLNMNIGTIIGMVFL